jgi:hypothetical protein
VTLVGVLALLTLLAIADRRKLKMAWTATDTGDVVVFLILVAGFLWLSVMLRPSI